jgi:hypothetical protein
MFKTSFVLARVISVTPHAKNPVIDLKAIMG